MTEGLVLLFLLVGVFIAFGVAVAVLDDEETP
jgi:hypothetical protein